MNVFVDANILLEFCGLSPRELEELKKLIALIDAGELVLWVPENVSDEVARNREKVLAEATKSLKDSRLKISFPEVSSGLPERQPVEQSLQDLQKHHSALIRAIEASITGNHLEADRVIAQLEQKGRIIPIDDVIVKNARQRRELRRPPGKAESLGDAVNWEGLLKAVPIGEDIHLITADPDFRSPLDSTHIRDYLADEWHRYNGAMAYLYPTLGAFSKKHFPAIDLATDVPKLRAINELASSPNFASTHGIVARLSNFDVFTPEQARMLLRAAADNSQVRWIAHDEDVYALLRRIIDAHRDKSDPSVIAMLEAEMHPPAPQASSLADDELPF